MVAAVGVCHLVAARCGPAAEPPICVFGSVRAWKVGYRRDFGTFYGLSWLLVSGSILEQFMSFIGRWETVQLKLAGQFHGLVLGAGMLHVPLLRRW
jgi:hypothetical protein